MCGSQYGNPHFSGGIHPEAGDGIRLSLQQQPQPAAKSPAKAAGALDVFALLSLLLSFRLGRSRQMLEREHGGAAEQPSQKVPVRRIQLAPVAFEGKLRQLLWSIRVLLKSLSRRCPTDSDVSPPILRKESPI